VHSGSPARRQSWRARPSGLARHERQGHGRSMRRRPRRRADPGRGVTPPTPPTREPHYRDNETYRWAARDCALGLIETLSGWCRSPLEFKGAVNGRVWHFQGDFADRAQLLFTSDKGNGRIELEVDPSNWVKAEVFVVDDLVFRCWIEDPYEEKEFYPDGSDGKPSS